MNIGSPVGFNQSASPFAGEVVRMGAFSPGALSAINDSLAFVKKPLNKPEKQTETKLKKVKEFDDEKLETVNEEKLQKQIDKKKRRQKKWKKPKDKPSRPLSAYNFFFQRERAQMLGADAPSAALESLKKRVHCKTHGKIGFAEMARAIAAKWKALPAPERKEFEDRARKEKERYSAELALWKESQKAPSCDDSIKGLDPMTANAVASDPTTASRSMVSNFDNTSASSLRLMMNNHQRNMSMLQRGASELDYIRAMQGRHVDQLLGFSSSCPPFENNLMNYPSAAEASANTLLQHFQSRTGAPTGSTPQMSQPRQGASSQFSQFSQLSQLSQTRPGASSHQFSQQLNQLNQTPQSFNMSQLGAFQPNMNAIQRLQFMQNRGGFHMSNGLNR